MLDLRKKVLIISYYWPPSGGPGVQRVLYFVKYLREFGWEPIVLTVESGEYPAVDHGLESLLPDDILVYRTKTIEPFSWYKKLTGKNKDHQIDTYVLTKKGGGIVEKFMRWLRLNVFIPDARIGWLWFGKRRGIELVKTHDIEIIYSCSPPHSVQLIGSAIARATGKKWVADFRDPWSDIVFYQNNERTRITNFLDDKLEKKVLANADALITTCGGFKDCLISQHGVHKDKIHVITNGYHRIAERMPAARSTDGLTITYAGNLSSVRIPESLVKGIAELKGSTKIFLKIAGNVSEGFKELVSKFEIEDRVEYLGYLSHNEVSDLYSNSDVLLLVIDQVPSNHLFIAGKLFDYLGALRPILAYGPETGEVRDIIEETDSGNYFQYKDIEGTMDFLKKQLAMKYSDTPSLFTFSNIERYSRKSLTHRLAGVFDRLAN